MINLSDKSNCCGCNACVQCCPKQCIIMHEDEEGFLYPKIESSYCIHCGLCETVCPMLNQNEPRLPQKVYAAKIIMKSNVYKVHLEGFLFFLRNKL